MQHIRLRFTIASLIVTIGLFTNGCSKEDDPVSPPPNPVDTTVNDAVRPIVFAHGFLEAADAWVPMSQLFLLNGYTETQLHAFDFESYITGSSADVQKMATQLQAKVNAVIQATGSSRVDVISHGIGSQAVQYYITKLDGNDRVAHTAFLGGVFDLSLTRNGSLTPGPVKYITYRSNGQDVTQNGDANKGTLTGADNKQVNNLDHQQLLASGEAFAGIHKFFNGKDAAVTKIPATQLLRTYYIKGRLISMFDNTPIPNSTVRFLYIEPATGGRQSNGFWRDVKTDPNGYYSFADTVRPISSLEVNGVATGYHETHIYKQTWRENSYFERVRMLPKSGGSAYVQGVLQGLVMNDKSAITLVHSPYQALYNGRDQSHVTAEIGDLNERTVSIINAGTAPTPGSGQQGSNTFMIFLFDHGANNTDGTGPVAVPALNTFGINAFDLYLDAVRAGLYGSVKTNNKTLYYRNWRTLGTSPNNQGISICHFEYY